MLVATKRASITIMTPQPDCSIYNIIEMRLQFQKCHMSIKGRREFLRNEQINDGQCRTADLFLVLTIVFHVAYSFPYIDYYDWKQIDC